MRHTTVPFTGVHSYYNQRTPVGGCGLLCLLIHLLCALSDTSIDVLYNNVDYCTHDNPQSACADILDL